MVSESTKWNRKLRNQLRKQWGGICNHVDCDKTEHLEFAHIMETGLSGIGRGSKERMRDIRDNPHAYTLLCKYHHRIFDNHNNSTRL